LAPSLPVAALVTGGGGWVAPGSTAGWPFDFDGFEPSLLLACE
jgi:hypothetical protein